MKDFDYYFKSDTLAVQIMSEMRSYEDSACFLESSLKPNMSILDVGCGAGSITIGLAKKVPDGRVVACDIGAAQIEGTKERVAKEQLNNVTVEQADIMKLAFEPMSFDVIFVRPK